jgi:peptidoglycan hydrolase-like protein with peptidoglycan-binding domain
MEEHMTRLAIAVVPLCFTLAGTAVAAAPALHANSVSPAMVQATKTVRKDDVLMAQRMLKRAGYYKGAIDGNTGAMTINAIEKFQKKNRLKQTGWLDEATWNGLRRQYGSTISASTNRTTHRS